MNAKCYLRSGTNPHSLDFRFARHVQTYLVQVMPGLQLWNTHSALIPPNTLVNGLEELHKSKA